MFKKHIGDTGKKKVTQNNINPQIHRYIVTEIISGRSFNPF